MKKTININLAGYPFTIDEDAYQLLKDYLDTIRYAFDTKEDTEDLASDIESRIAEILVENETTGFRIVNLEEVSKVIERIGKPSDFIEVEESVSEVHEAPQEEIKRERGNVTPPPYDSTKNSRNPFVRKRIYRDPQHAMLGGVCSGIAAYLGIDVTIVRLITVLLFFLSATTVAIVYIILWIVVPEAKTPIQRMQMAGEDPTVENIGKNVTENIQSENTVNETDKGGFTGFLNGMFSIFVKILIFLGLIIAIPVLIALGAALLGCLIAVFVITIGVWGGVTGSFWMFDTTEEGLMVLYILLAVIGGLITLGIPLWLLIKLLLKKNDSNQNSSSRRALLVVWLCGIAMTAIFSVKAAKQYHKVESLDWLKKLEIQENIEIEKDEIEGISIDEEGIRIQGKNNNIIRIDDNGIQIGGGKRTKSETVLNDSIAVVEKMESTDTLTIKENPIDQ